jgi:uncharacterized protein YbaR (Trm112 family)
MVSDELLAMLRCPGCRGRLGYNRERQLLTCADCSKEFRIEENIPIMLVNNAPSRP